MNYSLATPCFNCSHVANVHVVYPVANEEHGKKCVTCSCVDFQPCAGYSATPLRCLARRPELRCKADLDDVGAHLGDHHAVDADGYTVYWTDEAAAYPDVVAEKGTRRQQVGGVIGPELLARLSQVGGDHYRKHKIQPWDVWDEYDLDRYLANCVKYLLRAGDKGPKVQDLKKARHYLDKAIEREESGNG